MAAVDNAARKIHFTGDGDSPTRAHAPPTHQSTHDLCVSAFGSNNGNTGSTSDSGLFKNG